MQRHLSSLLAMSLTALIAVSVGCARPGASSGTSDVSFEAKLDAAKKSLATTPTGTKVLADLDQNSNDGHVTKIRGIKAFTNLGHAGRIKQISSGIYEIQIFEKSTVDDIAQAIAHEMSHLKNEVLEDAFLATQPDLNSRIEAVIKTSGTDLEGAYQAHSADIDFVYMSVFFEEVKAYEVNIQLQNEGLPFNNASLAAKGLAPYIRSAYIPQFLTMLAPDDGSDFVTTINSYEDVVDFQKNYLLKRK